MALATRCPHCNTTFRVAADLLKLRGGIVRCGSCHQIFDGNSALFDPDAVPAEDEIALPAPQAAPLGGAPAAHAEQRAPEPAPEPEPKPAPKFDLKYEPDANFDIEPPPLPFNGYVDFPLDLIDEADEPVAAPERPALAPQPQPQPQPPVLAPSPPQQNVVEAEGYYDDPPDYHDDPAPAPAPLQDRPSVPPGLEHGPLPLLRQASHLAPAELPAAPAPLLPRPSQARKKKPPSRPAPVEAPVVVAPPEPDEPAFVRRSREREESGRTRRIAMAAGSVLLAIALLAQGVTTFRNVLVARFPALKAPIGATCAVFGCRIELPADIDALSIETGELQTLVANNFSLVTLLRNQSGLTQAWPHIELALTDVNDKVLLRRVIAPADYLPQGILASKGFAANSEQPVKLLFEVSQIKASGYRIAIFYP